jgi:hypothetical protein
VAAACGPVAARARGCPNAAGVTRVGMAALFAGQPWRKLSGGATSAALEFRPGAMHVRTQHIFDERPERAPLGSARLGISSSGKANSGQVPNPPRWKSLRERHGRWRRGFRGEWTSTRSRPRQGRQFYTAQLQVETPRPMAPARASGQPVGCHHLNTLAALLPLAASLGFRCGKVGHILLRVTTSDAATRLIFGDHREVVATARQTSFGSGFRCAIFEVTYCRGF